MASRVSVSSPDMAFMARMRSSTVDDDLLLAALDVEADRVGGAAVAVAAALDLGGLDSAGADVVDEGGAVDFASPIGA